MARPCKAWQGWARPGKTRQGKGCSQRRAGDRSPVRIAPRGAARLGMAGQGEARLGTAGQGEAGRGPARQGLSTNQEFKK